MNSVWEGSFYHCLIQWLGLPSLHCLFNCCFSFLIHRFLYAMYVKRVSCRWRQFIAKSYYVCEPWWQWYCDVPSHVQCQAKHSAPSSLQVTDSQPPVCSVPPPLISLTVTSLPPPTSHITHCHLSTPPTSHITHTLPLQYVRLPHCHISDTSFIILWIVFKLNCGII